MEPSGDVRAVLAGSINDLVALPGDGRPVRNTPLGQIVGRIGQEPTTEVAQRSLGVEKLNPVRAVPVLIPNGVGAPAAVGSQELGDQELRQDQVGIEGVVPGCAGKDVEDVRGAGFSLTRAVNPTLRRRASGPASSFLHPRS